jgi:ABC-type multidrug transport system fused ATPase/permease subunit
VGLSLLEGSKICTDIWLVFWTSNQFQQWSLWVYIAIYMCLGLSQTLFNYVLGVIFAVYCSIAADCLHRNAFRKVLYSPISFFNSTPLGRIINRFSKDQDSIDNQLMDSLRMLVTTFLSTISILAVISVTSPWFLIPLLPVAILYYIVQDFYRKTARELKRLE